MRDLTNNNKSSNKSKSDNGQATADLSTTTNNANQPVAAKNVAVKASPEGSSQSGSLNDFRETIKDVLEEITWLEVNTMIVRDITLTKFDPQDFYTNLINSTMYKTEDGLRDIKKALLERSTKLKQEGALLSQAQLERHNQDLEVYNRDLEIYKRAERTFSDRQSSVDPRQKEQFEMETACYENIFRKVSQLNTPKDADGNLIIDAKMTRLEVLQANIPKNPDGSLTTDAKTTRSLRKLWELEQSVLNGERICAQTKLSLDGDLTNRFIEDLFVSDKGKKIDPTIAKLVFDLHNQAAENAQKQWSGLIITCVNLVKDLIPFRSK